MALGFFAGIKMDGKRGTPYMYTRDINVTLCSDCSDLTKGYTFMFGDMDNTGSMIFRNGVEVARHAARIPTGMNFHLGLFEINVEKLGGRLSFSVRDPVNLKRIDLVYEDPQPLSGAHVAIWTYDNAIMISRVTISGDGRTVLDHPDWQPGPLKTMYDVKP